MKKESIIGLIGLSLLIAFLWAYTAVKRSGVLKRSLTLYSEYDSIYHLKPNNWVYHNGMYVGYVSAEEKNEQTGKIKITMSIVEKVKLPRNTEAVITYTSIIGGRQINLVSSEPCFSDCLQGEEMLKGRVLSVPQSIKDATIGVRAKADSVLNKYSIRGNVDTLLYNTMASIENLRKNTDSWAKKIPQLNKTVNNSVKSYQQLSEDVKKKMPEYEKMLKDMNKQLAGVQQMQLNKQIPTYAAKIDSVDKSIQTNSTAITKAGAAVEGLDKQVKSFKNSPTAQKMMFQDSPAIKLHNNINQTDQKVKDIYENPEKYRRVFKK
jgi:ABC-type transporter Mla subunit MlaD